MGYSTLEMTPLYLAELVMAISALALGLLCFLRRTGGWVQVPIIYPWLAIKIVYTAGLLLGWFVLDEYAVFLLLIAGPASIAVLFAVRLWKHG